MKEKLRNSIYFCGSGKLLRGKTGGLVSAYFTVSLSLNPNNSRVQDVAFASPFDGDLVGKKIKNVLLGANFCEGIKEATNFLNTSFYSDSKHIKNAYLTAIRQLDRVYQKLKRRGRIKN